ASGSAGVVTVDGVDSTWTNNANLYVGSSGSGTLNITNGGLVSVKGTLTIDSNGDGDSFINMATGGMLALFGNAGDSLTSFLALVNGTDAIRYWDDSISAWANIMGATHGDDYTLAYLAGGALNGYTLLTVGTVPPPVPGDANRDGKVDDKDAKALAANWGQTGGWAQGDFNNDGAINALDAAILAANWGYGGATEQSSQTTSVPEPSILALLAMGAIGLFPCVARKRRTRL
ncbi:MAG: PEP-CTERM sorting domain-containing protein, partial [Pirellulaceae bacterium]|nr:PEP-CTERM sorting domain-containing protein [Pirellulaceae bacterium]